MDSNGGNSNGADDGGGIGFLFVLFLFVLVVLALFWLYKYKLRKETPTVHTNVPSLPPVPSTSSPGYQVPTIPVPGPPGVQQQAVSILSVVGLQLLLNALLRPGESLEGLRSLRDAFRASARFTGKLATRIGERLDKTVLSRSIKKMIARLPLEGMVAAGARFGKSAAQAGRSGATEAATQAARASAKSGQIATDAAAHTAERAGTNTIAAAFDVAAIVGIALDATNTGNLSELTSTDDWKKIGDTYENSIRSSFNNSVAKDPTGQPYPPIIGPFDALDDTSLSLAVQTEFFTVLGNPPTSGPIFDIVNRLVQKLHDQASSAPNQTLTADDILLVADEGANGLLSVEDYNTLQDYCLAQVCSSSGGITVKGPGTFGPRCSHKDSGTCLAATTNPLPRDDSADALYTEWRPSVWFNQFQGMSLSSDATGACIGYDPGFKYECETPITTSVGSSQGDVYDRTRGVCQNRRATCIAKGVDFHAGEVDPPSSVGGSKLDTCHVSVGQEIAEIIFGPTITRWVKSIATQSVQGLAQGVTAQTQQQLGQGLATMFTGGSYCPDQPGGACAGDALCAGDPAGRTKYVSMGSAGYTCCAPNDTTCGTCPAGKSFVFRNNTYSCQCNPGTVPWNDNCYTKCSQANIGDVCYPDNPVDQYTPPTHKCASGQTWASASNKCCSSQIYNGTCIEPTNGTCALGFATSLDGTTCLNVYNARGTSACPVIQYDLSGNSPVCKTACPSGTALQSATHTCTPTSVDISTPAGQAYVQGTALGQSIIDMLNSLGGTPPPPSPPPPPPITSCPVGQQQGMGVNYCVDCPVGTYKATTTTGPCMVCPTGTTTQASGSTSSSSCISQGPIQVGNYTKYTSTSIDGNAVSTARSALQAAGFTVDLYGTEAQCITACTNSSICGGFSKDGSVAATDASWCSFVTGGAAQNNRVPSQILSFYKKN